MWCLYLQTQRDALLKVILRAQDRQQRLARSSHLSPRVPPWKKNGPRGPVRGKGQRGTAGGTAVWPAGLPRPPHLVAAPPPGAPRGQGGKKTAQGGPWLLPPKPKS
jgi:hypothetical protein